MKQITHIKKRRRELDERISTIIVYAFRALSIMYFLYELISLTRHNAVTEIDVWMLFYPAITLAVASYLRPEHVYELLFEEGE